MSRTARWLLGVSLALGAAWLGLRAARGPSEPAAPVPTMPAAVAEPREIEAPAAVADERADVPAVPADAAGAPPAAQEEVALEPNAFVLEVLVHDDAGAPLPGATVTADQRPFDVGTTDESGRCALRIAPETRALRLQRVELSLDGYVTSVESVGLRKAELAARRAQRTWALARGIPFICRVVDEQGTPIEGARVRARPPSQFSDGGYLWTDERMASLDRGHNLSGFMPVASLSRSDSEGMATLVVPKGQFEITAWAPRFVHWPTQLERPNEPPEPVLVEAPQSQAPLEVRLVRGNTVRGLVRLEDGSPVANAEIYVDATWGTVLGRSDDRGRVEISGLPLGSSYRVLVTHHALAPLWKAKVLPGLFEEFVMSAGRGLRLRLRDADEGRPVEGRVEVARVSRDTDRGGRFLLKHYGAKEVQECVGGDLLVGRIGSEVESLQLTREGYEVASVDLPAGAGPDLGSLEVPLTPIRYHVIEVVDEMGRPIPAAELRVEITTRSDQGEIWRQHVAQILNDSLEDSTFRLRSDKFRPADEVFLVLQHHWAEFRQDPVMYKTAGEPAPEHFVMHAQRY